MIIQICVGSACYLKGSQAVIEMLQKAVAEHRLEDSITLCGSFCTGRCNREGVTITVDDDVFIGITRDNFKDFFDEKILKRISEEGK